MVTKWAPTTRTLSCSSQQYEFGRPFYPNQSNLQSIFHFLQEKKAVLYAVIPSSFRYFRYKKQLKVIALPIIHPFLICQFLVSRVQLPSLFSISGSSLSLSDPHLPTTAAVRLDLCPSHHFLSSRLTHIMSLNLRKQRS
jgi:hypothetical protein